MIGYAVSSAGDRRPHVSLFYLVYDSELLVSEAAPQNV